MSSQQHPRGRLRLAPAAVVAAVVLMATVFVGCGSSSKVATPGVTATSILIGSHQPLTGAAAPGYSEIAPAARAMFNYINATKGGVYGRKITYDYQDDAYNPTQTATVVRKLVLQNHVFAIANGLGTPTHEQVQPFLNSEKVPDLFVASGCVCWNQPKKYPYTTGYQTNYQIEGRILGQYIAQTFPTEKVGYLLQNDDVGGGGKAGLDEQLKPAQVVSKQSYAVAALGSGLGNEMAALQQSGAKVVAVFAIPAAFALAILAAAQIGYHPQFVASSIAASPSTMAGLIGSFSKGKAGAALLQGIITASYLPSPTDTTNPWTELFMKVHAKYDASEPFDANTVYGMSWAYNTYQLLLANGKNLTRASILATINKADLKGPGLLPLTFSATDHRGYEGEQMAKFGAGNTLTTFGPVYKAIETGPITTYTGGQTAPPAGF
jgi:branched-chain amino acid transport system substrate-binding protein